MDYKVIKPFGKFKKGDLLREKKHDHHRIIKRKLQEDKDGDPTIIPVENKQETKMIKEKYENKMIEKSEENKKGGK
jgi:uncharacterized protein YrzB (UPF0473 family)